MGIVGVDDDPNCRSSYNALGHSLAKVGSSELSTFFNDLDLGVEYSLKRSETDVFINLAVTTDIFLLPMAVAAPETIPAILAWNRGMWELSKAVPGGWGGFGGTTTQYFYWVEPIPGQ